MSLNSFTPRSGYALVTTCSKCSHEDTYILSKREAAFELYADKIAESACSQCGCKKYVRTSVVHPTLDEELMDMWGNEPDLYLMEQDEELFLSDPAHLQLLLKILDGQAYPRPKLDIVTEALCIMLYDLVKNPEQDQELTETVRQELTQRKNLVLLADAHIMDYIKEVVYPLISI